MQLMLHLMKWKKMSDQKNRYIPGGIKDEKGSYTKVPPKPEPLPMDTDISLDDIGERYLLILHRQSKLLLEQSTNLLNDEQLRNLGTCFKQWLDFKKQEKELLKSLSKEQLQELLKKAE